MAGIMEAEQREALALLRARIAIRELNRTGEGQYPRTPSIRANLVRWPGRRSAAWQPWMEKVEERLWGNNASPILLSQELGDTLSDRGHLEGYRYGDTVSWQAMGSLEGRTSHFEEIQPYHLTQLSVWQTPEREEQAALFQELLHAWPQAVLPWLSGFPRPLGHTGPDLLQPSLTQADLLRLALSPDADIRVEAFRALSALSTAPESEEKRAGGKRNSPGRASR